MSLGVVMLTHRDFDRAAALVRFWVRGGCPVVVHVDKRVPLHEYEAFVSALSDLKGRVRFASRRKCEWGQWGIVDATLVASELMLDSFPEVERVLLSSGSCLPLRPVAELQAFLDERPGVDFIESATTAEVPWIVGGLSEERFSLAFPFSWRNQRRLFDIAVGAQRLLRMQRKVPSGVVPHLGAQWWCLTRATLDAILTDPRRKEFDQYFRLVWIPDESYFQTLARRHAKQIHSASLTLAKFDRQGRPAIFYDDHLQLLRRSNCFIARKAWPRADLLYKTFLAPRPADLERGLPDPGKIDRLFANASDRRGRGRVGLYMQSRFPVSSRRDILTAAPYAVFEGFADVIDGFESWLQDTVGGRVHGHIFGPNRAEFAGHEKIFAGSLSDSASLRDYNPSMFLTNLIWNTRGERQIFQFGPADNQAITWPIAKDRNASICVVSGAWIIPMFRAGANAERVRTQAAELQKIEAEHIEALRSDWSKTRVRVWTLAEFLSDYRGAMQEAMINIGAGHAALTSLPPLVDLAGLAEFLQELKNSGMHPYLMGDLLPTNRKKNQGSPKPYVPR
ncbi:Glycosyl transferase family 14 [Ketogulonicigenium robustum]|uniref:Peptide O-xylosyltransferase n=1 Tax=Ketogulonicigenium robustum TaxID=92947 RepID=A0A1W6P2W7_9RHOB|nr:beta-1,6-N-acetylglucosaminyltransferase [Ketogulonicigenium robustum]ARO15637.1 Glycosyl transferase family 14 [Ketogulonicigenium robustum]